MSLFHRKKEKLPAYDPVTQRPAVRKSICTGEMTVGFIDLKTNQFRDVMMVSGQKELEQFCRDIGAKVEDVRTIY